MIKEFKPIEIDRKNLTLMGVPFPDVQTLESIAYGIGSTMYEGFEPTPRKIEIIRDFVLGKISISEFIIIVNEQEYV